MRGFLWSQAIVLAKVKPTKRFLEVLVDDLNQEKHNTDTDVLLSDDLYTIKTGKQNSKIKAHRRLRYDEAIALSGSLKQITSLNLFDN